MALRRESDPPDATTEFDLDDGRDALANWFEGYFGHPVRLAREAAGGYPDDTSLSGPTVISTGTLRAVASWFDDIDVQQMRLRFRANLEIGGVPPFWEDQLYSDRDHVVTVRIGDVVLRGVSPCQRCVVPTRDPVTGEEHPDFRRTFIEHRERTLPLWTDTTRFDHFFRLMVNTTLPREAWGSRLTVGDPVSVLGQRPVENEIDR